MRRLEFAFHTISGRGGESVYHFQDRSGRQWLAKHPWSWKRQPYPHWALTPDEEVTLELLGLSEWLGTVRNALTSRSRAEWLRPGTQASMLRFWAVVRGILAKAIAEATGCPD